jgi:gluconate 2-dehydrogenase gamma chain
MDRFSRRRFVATIGAATVAPASALLEVVPAEAAAPQQIAQPVSAAVPAKPVYLFFNLAEAAFIASACERLIPADKSGPGALGAGVPNYLDKQLGGAWGSGERLYRSGPWQSGSPSQGYQL